MSGDRLPDESPAIAREPTAEELERVRWEAKARWGRHGLAATGTGLAALAGGVALGAAHLVPAAWLLAAHGDGLLWMVLVAAPTLAVVYRGLLAHWDREAARFGAKRVSLDSWRA